MRRLLAFAPWLLAGPITGVLGFLAGRAIRNHEPVLAALYIAAIPLSLAMLSLIAARLGAAVG